MIQNNPVLKTNSFIAEKLQSVLSTSQWNLFKSYITSHTANFCGGSYPTMLLFQFIQHRTVNWNKITESFTFGDIRNGNRKYRHPGTGLNDKSIGRAKKFLIDNGVIQINKPHPKKIFYRLNLIGMAKFFIQCEYPYRNNSRDYEVLLEILTGLQPFFYKTNNEINFIYKGKPMQLKDVSEIVSKRAKASEQKRKETLNKKKLKVSMLPVFFKQSCEESSGNVKFSPAAWVPRDWGNAKNFLNECDSNNKNPRLIIQQVCEYWWKFRTRLSSENGKGVMLDEVVNFRQFFNFRGQIQAWLQSEISKDNSKPSTSKQLSLVRTIFYPNGEVCLISEEEYASILDGTLSYEDVYDRRKKAGTLPDGCMEVFK